MKLKFETILLAAVAACSSVASAIFVEDNLQHLATTGGTLTVGDKTFSDFSYVPTNLNNFVPGSVVVRAEQIGSNYFLSYTGQFAVADVTGLGNLAEIALFYTVTASAGIITSIDQEYAGNIVGGVGALAISEIVDNSLGIQVGRSNLSLGDTADDLFHIQDLDDQLILDFGGDSVLHVVKDIGLSVVATSPTTENGLNTVSFAKQSYHQENRVPDGGSALAFLGIALVGVEGMRRKMRLNS